MRTTAVTLILALLGILVLTSACSEEGEDFGVDTNVPPDTEITILPPSLEAAHFEVSFFWTGWDDDGTVEAFEWRMSSNGPDGILDVGDTLGLPWHTTVHTDTTFIVSAELDSFPDDVADVDQGPADYRFWQTHTLFMRAIDDKGVRDATPDHVSFTATTIAPDVKVTLPDANQLVDCIDSARRLSFGWTVSDSDDLGIEPAAVRYLLVELDEFPSEVVEQMDLAPGFCLARRNYNEINPIAKLPESAWSPWISVEAPEDSGRTVTFPNQDVGKRFLFAIQAKDRAGAVTPTFDWGVNVRQVKIGAGKAPLLSVREPFRPTENFVGGNGFRQWEVLAGQPISFSWEANASSYGGQIDAFRYGWNVVDPNDDNDGGWAVPWSDTWQSAETRSLSGGTHSFVTQCRDNSGSISRATYAIQVIPLPHPEEQRDLLVIDDWGFGTTNSERVTEAMWKDRWRAIFAGRVRNWSESTDFVNVREDRDRLDFQSISRYKGIVWFLNGGRLSSFFSDQFLPSGGVRPYNWIEVYQRELGNIMMAGNLAMTGSFSSVPSRYPVMFAAGDRSKSNWAYSGWCLEAIDYIRPGFEDVYCETGVHQRSFECDRMTTATLEPSFLDRFPSATGYVNTLHPNKDRLTNSPLYKLKFEEFYNTNITCRDVVISLRDCQQTMYRLLAARDDIHPDTGEPIADDAVFDCPPLNTSRSTLYGVPVAIASSVYSDTKRVQGSEDYLWGFHPLAFDLDEVRLAMLWIISERWQIPVNQF